MKKKYKIELKECYSCGTKFNPETQDKVVLIQGDYKMYFCESCSEKGEHSHLENSHPALTVPDTKYKRAIN